MPEHKPLEVAHIAARLLGLELPMGLTLDEVIIQGEGLTIRRHPFGVQLDAPGSMEVRLSAESLVTFLNEKKPGGLSGFKVKIAGGHLEIEARVPLLPFSATAICRVLIVDGTKLNVELVRLDSIGGSGAANMVQRQLDSINPVVDTADFPVAATLKSVDADNDWLVLHGTIAPK